MNLKTWYLAAASALLAHPTSSSEVAVEHHVGSLRTVAAIKERLHMIARSDDREFEKNTTLDKSFDGAVLFK